MGAFLAWRAILFIYSCLGKVYGLGTDLANGSKIKIQFP